MGHDSALEPAEEEESDKLRHVLQFNVVLIYSLYSEGYRFSYGPTNEADFLLLINEFSSRTDFMGVYRR